MKRPFSIVTLALLASLPLAALASPSDNAADLDDLAELTGLSTRQVQMVVGNPTAYAEYLTQYDWARHRMQTVLGAQRLDDLIAGRAVRLDDGRLVAIEVAQR